MNYILFFPDEMRADSLGCYGNPFVKTPNYDRLSQEGVRFDQCHVENPVCSPSRCCLMTGWYPHVRGHRTLWHLLQPDEPSLFAYLKKSGYQIQWFGKNDLYSQQSLHDCVDNCVKTAGGHAGKMKFQFGDSGFYSFVRDSFKPDITKTADYKNVHQAIDFLNDWQETDKPFMIYLPLSMPHPPYSAPEPYHSMYKPDDVGTLRPIVESGKPDFHKLIRDYRNLDQLDDQDLKEVNAIYHGMVSCMDALLGQLMDAMEKSGRNKDTTLIVSSDHGDWAGDYGLVEKWPNALDDTLTHVPLLIKSPGCAQGHVVPEIVELFDIMPTVLEMSGIDCQHTHYAKSLVSQINGAPGDPHRHAYAEGGYNLNEPNCFEGYKKRNIPSEKLSKEFPYYPKFMQQQECPDSVCRATMVRSLTHKLIYRVNGVCELYDLVKDPQELTNVYGDSAYASIQNDLLNNLLQWYQSTSDSVPYREDHR